jgi:protein-S-isoprenylcysteine O-methyltransferase Ste14
VRTIESNQGTLPVKALEHRIPPPFVVLIIGGAMWLIARMTSPFALPSGLRLGLVVSLIGFGLAMGGAGFRAFARARTTIDPVNLESASALVTTGIFRLSRNPMYVGFAALLTAWAIWLQAPLALTGVLAFMAFTWRYQILPEERVLSTKFGSPYEDYRNRVRRWL